MSDEGSIPSGRAAPDGLSKQVVSERATEQTAGAWSGVGPKPQKPRVGDTVEIVTLDTLKTPGKPDEDWVWVKRKVVDVRKVGVAGVDIGEEFFVDGEREPFCSWDDDRWRWPLHATAGKNGVPELPAVPEAKRCRGLTEIDHTWTCDACLGPDDGDQCAHCRNLEAQIRAEDAAVEEGERQDAEQAVAFEQLLASHQGDARAVVSGVVRTLVAAGALSEGNARVLRVAAEGVIGDAFDKAAHLTGLPLMLFWSLVADMAQAERNSLRRQNAEAFRGCA